MSQNPAGAKNPDVDGAPVQSAKTGPIADETASPSVDAAEIEKFSELSAQWWEPAGPFAPLHKLNPARLRFVRDVAAEHFARDARSLRPFEGLSLLDVGCGGGLLSEPMARLGFDVLGCDASDANVQAASAHAPQRRDIRPAYRNATAEQLVAEECQFDVVLSMEVVEHVADVPLFLQSTALLVRPGGLLFVGTINKTLRSLVFAKIGAEYVLRWLPQGTHDWARFIPPADLERVLRSCGLQPLAKKGTVFDPVRQAWRLSDDTAVNYLMAARR